MRPVRIGNLPGYPLGEACLYSEGADTAEENA